jgi:hypothetical protein
VGEPVLGHAHLPLWGIQVVQENQVKLIELIFEHTIFSIIVLLIISISIHDIIVTVRAPANCPTVQIQEEDQ